MGDLIVMTRATRPLPAIAGAGATADILFFTGVRYYRMPDMPAVSIDHSGPVRRRPAKIKKLVAAKKPSLPRHPKRRVADHH